MNLRELETFVENFIKENKLKDNSKNRNIIKMVLRSSKVKSLTEIEKSEFLKEKFLN